MVQTQALIALLNQHQWPQVLVFIKAKDNADSLTKRLNKAKISVSALHGNKSQEERTQALESFKNGETRVLIATDVMARGIHIDQLPVASLTLTCPSHSATYVHRKSDAQPEQEALDSQFPLWATVKLEHLDAIRTHQQSTSVAVIRRVCNR